MRVKLVASASMGMPQLFTSFVIDETIAIDAGCLERCGDLECSKRIKHVFLTHAHLDHIASLPPFLDAVYDGSGNCVKIHGNAETLDCLQRDVFNNRLYPDFIHISTFRPPYLTLNPLRSGQTVDVEGLRVTAVAVPHAIPAMGYIVEDDHATVVFPGDTGPTEEIWRLASARNNLRAVFLECTFPNSMAWLADLARHLTPESFAKQVNMLPHPVRVIAVHMHPRYQETVIEELRALALPWLDIGEPGVTYLF